MGTVFLAADTVLDRQVAPKFLPPNLWDTPAARQRLVREAKAVPRLDHSNVVTIHSLEEHDGRIGTLTFFPETQRIYILNRPSRKRSLGVSLRARLSSAATQCADPESTTSARRG